MVFTSPVWQEYFFGFIAVANLVMAILLLSKRNFTSGFCIIFLLFVIFPPLIFYSDSRYPIIINKTEIITYTGVWHNTREVKYVFKDIKQIKITKHKCFFLLNDGRTQSMSFGHMAKRYSREIVSLLRKQGMKVVVSEKVLRSHYRGILVDNVLSIVFLSIIMSLLFAFFYYCYFKNFGVEEENLNFEEEVKHCPPDIVLPTNSKNISEAKTKVSLLQILKNDYASFVLLLFSFMFMIILFVLYLQDNNSLSSFVIFGTLSLLLLALFLHRIFYFQHIFQKGYLIAGVVLEVWFYKDRGRVEYVYQWQQKEYFSGNAILKNKTTEALQYGQKVGIVIDVQKPQKTFLFDLYS